MLSCITKETFKWDKPTPAVYECDNPKGSETIRRLCREKPGNFILQVDYQDVMEWKYYGRTKPPERPYEAQLYDWTHGYQWSRVGLYSNCKVGGDYYYWVKHRAKLTKMEKVPDEMILEFTMHETINGAIAKLSNNLKSLANKLAGKITGWKVLRVGVEGNKLKIRLKKIKTEGFGFVFTSAAGIASIVLGLLIVFSILVLGYKIVDAYRDAKIAEFKTATQSALNACAKKKSKRLDIPYDEAFKRCRKELEPQLVKLGVGLKEKGGLFSDVENIVKYSTLALFALVAVSILKR